MEVRVHGRGVRITERIRTYAVARVVRAARSFDRLGDVDVNLVSVDPPEAGKRFRAELSTHSAGHSVRAEGDGDTMEHALDAAADRFGARLRRLGERLTERRRQRPGSPATDGTRSGDLGEASGPADRIPEIVRLRPAADKPMTPEDAALVMDQQGHSFLVFTNAETGRFGVLYRRNDGRLGLIEPE